MVTRLDRLARSTRDLLNTLAAIIGKDAGQREAITRRDRGEPLREIAQSYDVSHSTISRLVP